MIPKLLHIVWIGDESRRPDNCIRTWSQHNPGWTVRVWGNRELAELPWVNAPHMRAMARRELAGVADLMRWEILHRHGGVAVDADSACRRALPDWLLELEAFACWESELARPRLIATAAIGTAPGNAFFGQLVEDLRREPQVTHDLAWVTVGPLRFTRAFRQYHYANLTILPSHFFIPVHYTGVGYTGTGPVYAEQYWASTRRSYNSLHQLPLHDPAPSAAAPADG